MKIFYFLLCILASPCSGNYSESFIMTTVQTSLSLKRLFQLCSNKPSRVDWPWGESILKQTNTDGTQVQGSHECYFCMWVVYCLIYLLPICCWLYILNAQLGSFIIHTQPQSYTEDYMEFIWGVHSFKNKLTHPLRYKSSIVHTLNWLNQTEAGSKSQSTLSVSLALQTLHSKDTREE